MKKKEIKKILNKMGKNEMLCFYDGEATHHINKYKNSFKIYSFGNNWSDQIPEEFTAAETLNFLWDFRPKKKQIFINEL